MKKAYCGHESKIRLKSIWILHQSCSETGKFHRDFCHIRYAGGDLLKFTCGRNTPTSFLWEHKRPPTDKSHPHKTPWPSSIDEYLHSYLLVCLLTCLTIFCIDSFQYFQAVSTVQIGQWWHSPNRTVMTLPHRTLHMCNYLLCTKLPWQWTYSNLQY